MKRITVSLAVLLVLVLLSSCSEESGLTAQSHPMDAWIDAAIQGKEREIIREKLSWIPESDRENFTYIDADGTVYANKPSLKNVHSFTETKQPGTYVDAQGVKQAFPIVTPKPSEPVLAPTRTFDSNYTSCPEIRGAYRRMVTKEAGASGPRGIPGRRFTYMSADVSLKGGSPSDVNMRTNTEVAYFFLGGWGVNGQSVDAGLQFGQRYRDWALFIRYSGQGKVFDSQGDDERNLRFAPDQTIKLRFYVARDSFLVLSGTGKNINNRSQTRTESVMINVSNAGRGWPKDGYDSRLRSGINMKHNAAIANTLSGERYSTGSVFRGTAIPTTRFGNGIDDSTARPLQSSDVAKICYHDPDVVSVSGGRINIALNRR